MSRLWSFLIDPRTLSAIGILALIAFLFLGADVLSVALVWAAGASAVVLAVALGVWLYRRQRERRAAAQFGQALEQQAQDAVKAAPAAKKAEVEALRQRLQEAVKTIKTSRLGQETGPRRCTSCPGTW
ncbi:hypothetical protein [Schlegelella aquatica]|uniref:hypothetical protein n=1 Tax=Caldimonas aquatica TaxID=376175 RepID=UPI0037528C7B